MISQPDPKEALLPACLSMRQEDKPRHYGFVGGSRGDSENR
jgi:hypothetical protein